LNKVRDFLKRIDKVNAAFLLLTPAIGIGGTCYLAATGEIHWATAVLALVMAIATGIAITGGYHRLFSHKSYDAKPLYKLLMLVFGAAAFENSALRWASDHRNHHKFVDTDQDPYNIKRGFWYAHMGWVMFKYDEKHCYDNVADLEADPLVRFQNRHYVTLGIFIGFFMPTMIAALWGDPLGGLLIAGCLRTVMNHHFTFSINSFAHLVGSRPYSDQDTSRDNWVLALLTYGEGYHNYHHRFPADYRNGIHSYHWDPTKWLIKLLETTGQTYNLRKISNETILRVRLKMDEKRMLRKLASENHRHISHELVASARLKIEEAYSQFRHVKGEYKRLKDAKLHEWSAQWAVMHERVESLKADLKRANETLKQATSEWVRLCGHLGVPAYELVYS